MRTVRNRKACFRFDGTMLLLTHKKPRRLSDATITFLDAYRYGDELLIKLAQSMR